MSKDTFDDIFKSKLENHSIPVEGDQIWSKIDSQLPSNSLISTSIASKILFFGSGLAVLIGSVVYMSNNQDSNFDESKFEKQIAFKNTKENSANLPIEEIVSKETISSTVTFKNESLTAPIKPKNSAKETKAPSNNFTSDSYVPFEQIPVIVAKPSSSNDLPPTKSKQAEKTYAAGETIRLRFEFQNVSGFPTKSVETWIEFPEWIDASSVKTVDYRTGLEVKTSIKHKFNTVVWVAKGNFGSDLSKMDSKGYIEYSCVLTEAKTEKDIASIKPLLK